MSDTDARSHWQKVYTEKEPTGVSWHQAVPERSLALIDAAMGAAVVGGEGVRIIDVGAGASSVAGHLVKRPGVAMCVVDISAKALEHARRAVGTPAESRVRLLEADITGQLDVADGWADVWHDRAAFHFLTTPQARKMYAGNVSRILKPGGTAIVAAFAPDGPEKCSGLPVQRHDGASIAAELSAAGRAFALVEEQREDHTTPWGSVQRFVYAVLRG